MCAAGYRLDGPAFQALFMAYDPDRNGTLDATELMAMMVFLQSATAAFQAFDPQRQGRITINHNHFVYAAASGGWPQQVQVLDCLAVSKPCLCFDKGDSPHDFA